MRSPNAVAPKFSDHSGAKTPTKTLKIDNNLQSTHTQRPAYIYKDHKLETKTSNKHDIVRAESWA